jgi:diacylglycerol O-acyltransferase / wax synthase
MSTRGRRRIGPVDALWLNMDRPNNLMVITSLVFLESVPDWDEVRRIARERFVDRYPVFRQRPVEPSVPIGLPSWEHDPDFDLERHLVHETLAAPGDDAALQAHVEDHLHRPFDRRHPLWEVHLIEGYGTGAVVFFRIHHALADGIALTRVLMSLTDNGASVDAEPADDEPAAHRAPWVVSTGVSLTRSAVEQAAHLAHPSGMARALGVGARTGKVVRDLLFLDNPPNVVGGTPGPHKRIVWTQPVPLAPLKHVGHLAGATLNDVLLSVVAGALHHYQVEHGATPVDLVTMVPVNVRPLDKPLPRELGNQFALVFFTFPSSRRGLLERLAETKRRMDWLKSSPESVLTFGLITAIGFSTPTLERPLVDFFANKAIGVTTNVMGPREPRTFAGVPVTGVLGWVPGSGTHTVGVCIFTYAGSVRVGFMVDAGVVPEPQSLLVAFEDEVEALVRLGRDGEEGTRHANRHRNPVRRGAGHPGRRAGTVARRRKPA